MRPYQVIGELETGQRDRFAILSIDPTQREGNGCKAIVLSLHPTREEAFSALTPTNNAQEQ
jgi:hypothetical protein